ncbi:MAG: hypothetical protein K6T94_10030 [Paenibacillus sp.]|nr:hypothetical protein [Paenibacillus sp.]
MKLFARVGLFMLLVGVLVGCNKVRGNEIQSIKVECVDICKDQGEKTLFTEKTFNDADDIKTFARAINKATKIQGELDYGAYFYMYIYFENSSQKKYVLNISNEVDKGIKGLLVDSADSGKGYSIPEEFHNELSTLIYQ